MYTRILNNPAQVLREIDCTPVPITDAGYVAWLALGFTPADPLPVLPPAGQLRVNTGKVLAALIAKGTLKMTDVTS